jgi:hypothetical protein
MTKTLKDRYIEAASALQNEQEVIETAESYDDTTAVETDLFEFEAKKAVRHKGRFRNFLVTQGRAKFGCPRRCEANRLVVRKHLHDVCVEHGLIARHINDHLDFATEMVFIPTKNQLLAQALSHTELSRLRAEVLRDLGGQQATIA